jgi:hypothetical protein
MTANWRQLGDCTPDQFAAALKGSPLEADAAALYRTAQGYTILLLAQLQHESNFGREGVATTGGHNPLGLRPRGGGTGFQWFASWLAAVSEWVSRITDPTYAYGKTATVAEYIHIYAPTSDGNDEAAYVAEINQVVDRYTPAAPE